MVLPRNRFQFFLPKSLRYADRALALGVLEAVAAMAVFFFVLDAAGWQYGETLA